MGGAWLAWVLQALQGSFHVAFCSHKRLAVAPLPPLTCPGAQPKEIYSSPRPPPLRVPPLDRRRLETTAGHHVEAAQLWPPWTTTNLGPNAKSHPRLLGWTFGGNNVRTWHRR